MQIIVSDSSGLIRCVTWAALAQTLVVETSRPHSPEFRGETHWFISSNQTTKGYCLELVADLDKEDIVTTVVLVPTTEQEVRLLTGGQVFENLEDPFRLLFSFLSIQSSALDVVWQPAEARAYSN